MLQRSRLLLSLLALSLLVVSSSAAEKADVLASLTKGKVMLKSAGPLAFGPEGILFVGDPRAATIHAIDTGDRVAPSQSGRPMVKGINQKLAGMLGTDVRQVSIADLAVNPISGNTYLSVRRGRGPDAAPLLIKVDRSGKLSEFSLDNVKCSMTKIPNAPGPDAVDRRRRPLRVQSITDLAYVDGQLIVAGLSNEEWASTLRAIPFPFSKNNAGTGVEIFHGSHGRFETNAPVRTFEAIQLNGELNILAAYTCTPLVRFPVADLKPGAKVKGTTIAELGNRNSPLDMVVYKKGGKDYLLIANSSRGVMKLPIRGASKAEGITSKIAGTAGLKYEPITSLKGVVQMDGFDKDHALVLLQADDGTQTLKTIELP
jgi:hypothetical protein